MAADDGVAGAYLQEVVRVNDIFGGGRMTSVGKSFVGSGRIARLARRDLVYSQAPTLVSLICTPRSRDRGSRIHTFRCLNAVSLPVGLGRGTPGQIRTVTSAV